MKILFESNVKQTGIEISSINQSINFSPYNLADKSLNKRYQAVSLSDTITITFPEAISISAIFAGYSNISDSEIRFYDSGDTLLGTTTIGEISTWIAIYLTQIDSVSYCEIDVESPMGGNLVYLGGVEVGVPYTMPDPVANWKNTPQDNSEFDQSPGGQARQNYERPLRSYTFSFKDIEKSITDEIMDLYYSIGQGYPIWIDPFEDNHSYMEPFYGIIVQSIQPQKNARRYDFDITFREAR